MTDLTNKVDTLIKTDINSIQGLVNKYSTVLQEVKPEKHVSYLAYIIDICVNHINQNHKDLSRDWKAWSVVVIINTYFKGNIKCVDDIIKTIDELVAFWKSEYKTYCQDIISASEYDRDWGFVFKFISKKNR